MTKLFCISIGIVGILIFIVPISIILIEGGNTHTIIMECYDRYFNEIIGLDCEDEVYDSELVQTLANFAPTLVILGFGLMFIGMVLYLMDDLNSYLGLR